MKDYTELLNELEIKAISTRDAMESLLTVIRKDVEAEEEKFEKCIEINNQDIFSLRNEIERLKEENENLKDLNNQLKQQSVEATASDEERVWDMYKELAKQAHSHQFKIAFKHAIEAVKAFNSQWTFNKEYKKGVQG